MAIKAIRNWNIATKVAACAILLIAAFVGVLFGWVLPTLRERVYAEKQNGIRQGVESTYSLIAYYGAAAEQGRLTDAQAREQALKAVGALRYDTTNYFWINDSHPTMVMHPITPELNGTDLTEKRDPDGSQIFVKMADVCRKDGAGFVGLQLGEARGHHAATEGVLRQALPEVGLDRRQWRLRGRHRGGGGVGPEPDPVPVPGGRPGSCCSAGSGAGGSSGRNSSG